MMRRWLAHWLNNFGPNREAHNERLKLIAVSVNAAGIASLIGGLFAPIFDPSRRLEPALALFGVGFWLICLVAAIEILGYIKAKD